MRVYEDMMNLPYHPRNDMARIKRAAQFAPFAALTGYDEAVQEEERLTEQKKNLCEDALEELDAILRIAAENPEVEVRITCFLQDGAKSGGRRESIEGRVKHMDGSSVLLEDGRKRGRIDIETVEIIRGER